MRLFKVLLIVSMLLPTTLTVWAADEEVEVNYLDLAGRLIRDGYYDRAQKVLSNVDMTDEELDVGRYHSLYGLLHLHLVQFEKARDSFLLAMKAGLKDPYVHVYLAQAYFGLHQYRSTLQELAQAPQLVRMIPSLYLVKARSHWNIYQHRVAWRVISNATRIFVDNRDLRVQKLRFLLELKLYQSAIEEAEMILEDFENPAAWKQVAALFQSNAKPEMALMFLERAYVKFPNDITFLTQLAVTRFRLGHTYVAALLFEKAAYQDPKFFREAAELFHKSGRVYKALVLNGHIEDQNEKLKQRLAILVKLGQFETIVAMEPRLSRLGLLKEEDIRYAVAYSYYKTGGFPKAQELLAYLSNASLFRKATQLRKQMSQCQSDRWQCI